MDAKDLITKEALERALLLTLTDIKKQDDNLQKQIDDLKNAESPLLFDTYANFPPVGDNNRLYVDTNANKIYRYDDIGVCYRLITGFDFENDEIESIQCIL